MSILKKAKKNRLSAGPRSPSAGPSNRVKPSQYYRPLKPVVESSSHKNSFNLKASKFNIGKIVNFMIIFGFIVVFAYTSTLTTNPTVQLTSSNVVYRNQNEYKQGVNKVLESNMLYRSKLLVDTEKVEKEIRNMFPELSDVALIVPIGGRNPKVVLKSASAIGVISQNQENSIVTNSGTVVKGLVNISSENLISIALLNLNLSSFETGNRVLTTVEVNLINLLSAELQDIVIDGKPLKATELSIDFATGRFELSFKDFDFVAKLTARSDIREEVGSLKATLAQLSEDSSLPTEYIDVRVPGRVFVK